MRRLALIPLLAFVFACNDSQPMAPDDLAPQLSVAGAPVQTASGSGNFQGRFVNPAVFPGRILGRTFAFAAKKWADGSVTGQWTRHLHCGPFEQSGCGGKSHGVVTCMTVIGNTAYLGGYATSGRFSEPPNNEVGWFVVDNGEGANDPPDIMSLQWVEFEPGFAQSYCDTQQPEPGFREISGGDITVDG